MGAPLESCLGNQFQSQATTGARERPRRQDGVAQDRKRQEP